MADRSRFEPSSSAVEHIRALSGQTLDTLLAAIEQDAKRLAPVDTGHLRAQISTEKVDDASGLLIADTDYAVFVELGTSKMRAQPYLRPAVYRRRSV